ncbi:MAG TPA: hypothetical protein VM222_00950 [Planctomycetota bacterium]|nr:hypothetical protein [Planctomycetota bacterium]
MGKKAGVSAFWAVTLIVASSAPAWAQTGDPQLAAQTSTPAVAAGSSSNSGLISTGSNVVQKKVLIRVLSGGGCGLLGLEALFLWIFRRFRPLPAWRRKNGHRWIRT